MDMTDKTSDSRMARRLAPEDIEPGQFVAVHRQKGQFLWLACEGGFESPKAQVLEVDYVPDHSGRPLKVEQVCLPYVQVKTPHRRIRTLDTRMVQLVELSPAFVKAIWKACKPAKKAASTDGPSAP